MLRHAPMSARDFPFENFRSLERLEIGNLEDGRQEMQDRLSRMLEMLRQGFMESRVRETLEVGKIEGVKVKRRK